MMNDSLLISFAKLIRGEEWTKLGEFVYSPVYNKNEKLRHLYGLLLKKKPFDTVISKTDFLPILGKKKRYPKNYIIGKKEDSQLRNLFSSFTGLIKDFFIFLEAKNYPSNNQRHLVSSMMKRKGYDLIPPVLEKSMEGHLSFNEGINNRYYFDYFQLAEVQFYWYLINKNRKEKKIDAEKKLKSKENVLNEAFGAFRDYYTGVLLMFFCAAKNMEKILNVKFENIESNWILTYLEAHSEQFKPLVQAYFWNLRMLMDTGEENFRGLKEILKVHGHTFTKAVLREHFGIMINYCARKIRNGERKYKLEKKQLYTESLELNIWEETIAFSPHNFINIVRNSLSLNDIEDAERFVEEYKVRLDPKYSKLIPQLAKLYCLFSRKNSNFRDIANILRTIKKECEKLDFFYFLQIKVLTIQYYYERYPVEKCIFSDKEEGKSDLMENALESLERYLERDKKMSQPIKSAYFEFKTLTKTLYSIRKKWKYQNIENKLKKLEANISTTKGLYERDWLEKMVGKFRQKK